MLETPVSPALIPVRTVSLAALRTWNFFTAVSFLHFIVLSGSRVRLGCEFESASCQASRLGKAR